MGRKVLWFSRVVDIGRCTETGSELIEVIVNTVFEITNEGILVLQRNVWVSEVNRLQGDRRRIQLIVRCADLPPHLASGNFVERLQNEVVTTLCRQ